MASKSSMLLRYNTFYPLKRSISVAISYDDEEACMKRSWTTAVLLGILAAAPAVTVLADDAKEMPGAEAQEHHWDPAKMQKKFDLSDDQVTKLKALKDSQKDAMKTIMDKHHDLMKQLAD